MPGELLSPAQALRRECAAAFDVTEAKLMGRARSRKMVIPRHATCYVLRHRLNLSYPTIARLMGGRDHSTIIHAVRQTQVRITSDLALARKVFVLLNAALPVRKFDAYVHRWHEWRRNHWAALHDEARVPVLRIGQQQRIGAAEPADELAEFMEPDRLWCSQCDTSVALAAATRCQRRFCPHAARAPQKVAAS